MSSKWLPWPSVDRAGDSGAVAAATANIDAAAELSSGQAADTTALASSELLAFCPSVGLGCALIWLCGVAAVAAAAAASSPVKHSKNSD